MAEFSSRYAIIVMHIDPNAFDDVTNKRITFYGWPNHDRTGRVPETCSTLDEVLVKCSYLSNTHGDKCYYIPVRIIEEEE